MQKIRQRKWNLCSVQFYPATRMRTTQKKHFNGWYSLWIPRSNGPGRAKVNFLKVKFIVTESWNNSKMPILRIETNLPRSKVPEDFVSSVPGLIAKALGKPEQYCVAAVIPDVIMSFGGSNSPCAFVTLMSIGNLGVQENMKLSATIGEHIEKHLGVPKDKFYIQFIDEKSANVGYNSTTFYKILGS